MTVTRMVSISLFGDHSTNQPAGSPDLDIDEVSPDEDYANTLNIIHGNEADWDNDGLEVNATTF
jgi:hypothetical protein